MPVCAVCGNGSYLDRVVIWDALAEGWGLTREERGIVDRQQGTYCTGCFGNLRSIALAKAITVECGWGGTLQDFVASEQARSLRLLELNEAGTLSPVLRGLRSHVFGAYPEVDMQAMPFGDGSFDMIVHSDTLEHVPDPARALRECARVLTPEGALCFTVPVVPGRMSVSRAGLPALYHG
ncbi:MAG: methyltransferase domain-containing protein, partial [Roseococcus sp.]